jgi:hypothetical protein
MEKTQAILLGKQNTEETGRKWEKMVGSENSLGTRDCAALGNNNNNNMARYRIVAQAHISAQLTEKWSKSYIEALGDECDNEAQLGDAKNCRL